VTGRDRTCDAPRFRRALYRAELRSRDIGVQPEVGQHDSWSRTNDLPLIRRALCLLSYSPQCVSEQSWIRTSNPLFVRQALSQLSYPPAVLQIRDKGSNLDLRVQSLASFRLDDLGATVRPSVHPRARGRRSGVMPSSASVTSASRTMLSVPLAYPSTLDRRGAIAQLRIRRPTWRSFGARRSSVGRKSAAKANCYSTAVFCCATQQRGLSLSGGASSPSCLFQMSITFLVLG
jgi:hypothetical protein